MEQHTHYCRGHNIHKQRSKSIIIKFVPVQSVPVPVTDVDSDRWITSTAANPHYCRPTDANDSH